MREAVRAAVTAGEAVCAQAIAACRLGAYVEMRTQDGQLVTAPGDDWYGTPTEVYIEGTHAGSLTFRQAWYLKAQINRITGNR